MFDDAGCMRQVDLRAQGRKCMHQNKNLERKICKYAACAECCDRNRSWYTGTDNILKWLYLKPNFVQEKQMQNLQLTVESQRKSLLEVQLEYESVGNKMQQEINKRSFCLQKYILCLVDLIFLLS